LKKKENDGMLEGRPSFYDTLKRTSPHFTAAFAIKNPFRNFHFLLSAHRQHKPYTKTWRAKPRDD
jgi:hypothetical protein